MPLQRWTQEPLMHIAIYLTNNDTAAFAKAYPNDGEKVAEMMRVQRPNWRYTVVRCIDGEFPTDFSDIDGVIITGSPASINDDKLPWVAGLLASIRRLHDEHIPLIGICFGHQAIARALGGEVRQAETWGMGRGHTHWDQPQMWMTPMQSDMTLMAAHQEQVTRLPNGATAIGGSSHCPIGSMLIGETIWTTQFHPEMSQVFMDDLLDFLESVDYLPADVIAKARADRDQPNDAHLFSKWMAQFFEQAASDHHD